LSCLTSIRLIIHFKPENVDESFKADWKQVERAVKEKYPALKLVYSRADPQEGDLAFSQLRLKKELIDELTSTKLTIQDKSFTFKATEGEELKEFWQKQGGHY
jgi:hypothetical protein